MRPCNGTTSVSFLVWRLQSPHVAAVRRARTAVALAATMEVRPRTGRRTPSGRPTRTHVRAIRFRSFPAAEEHPWSASRDSTAGRVQWTPLSTRAPARAGRRGPGRAGPTLCVCQRPASLQFLTAPRCRLAATRRWSATTCVPVELVVRMAAPSTACARDPTAPPRPHCAKTRTGRSCSLAASSVSGRASFDRPLEARQARGGRRG
jgi:hypothetical protein